MNTLLTIIGTIFTILSFSFAIYQSCKIIKIKRLRIYDALLLHKLSGQALGAIQGINSENKMLKRLSEKKSSKEKIIYDIGQTEGYCQSILIETAKIYCSLKDITIQEVNSMIEKGILCGNKEIYLPFAKNKNKCLKKS